MFRNRQHLDYLNQLNINAVVVGNSCNPYTMTKIFLCTMSVLVGMGFLLINALTNFEVYEETIILQIFMVLWMHFCKYFILFSILINSHDMQRYGKRKFLNFLNLVSNVVQLRQRAVAPFMITEEKFTDCLPLSDQSQQDLEFIKKRLMMHIRIKYIVKNCLRVIFDIYETTNYVRRGVKKIHINKVFNETEIQIILSMYPENTEVYQMLTQYCIIPVQICRTDRRLLYNQRGNNCHSTIITVHH